MASLSGGRELSSGTDPGGKTHLGVESIGGHGHSEGLECVCVCLGPETRSIFPFCVYVIQSLNTSAILLCPQCVSHWSTSGLSDDTVSSF